MSNVFISYSRKDYDLAAKLVTILAENDLNTWIDWKSIPKGEDWEQEIYRGIDEAESFLFLISPDSVVSEMCNKEIAHAVATGKRILPVVIRDAHKDIFWDPEAGKEISRHNWIFCREGKDFFQQAVEEIQTTIRTDHAWVRFHTELLVKAKKWMQRKDSSRLLRGKELREAEQYQAKARAQPDPKLIQLQRDYLLASRVHEDRQRQRAILGLSIGIVLLSFLAVAAMLQRNIAVNQTNAKATALVNEQIARDTAVAEKSRADEQSQIAQARQLAAQAELLINQEPQKLDRAVLLSIESLHQYHTYEGDEALRRGLALLPKVVLHSSIQPASSSLHMGEAGITAIVFSPDGKWLAIGTRSESISVWDTSTWREVMRVEPAQDGGVVRVVRSLAFSPDSHLLVSGVDSGFAQVWDITTHQEISHYFHDDQVFAVAFSPDGKMVASGAVGNVVLWDPFSGKEILHVSGGNDFIIFSPDSQEFATANCEKINVWDVSTGSLLTNKDQFPSGRGSTECVSALAFSPDGTLLASADGESGSSGIFPRPKKVGGTIRIWKTLTGEDVSVMRHGDSVRAIAFSENGTRLVSGSNDRTSRVWNVTTGQPIYEFTYGPSVTAVGFGKNGSLVVAAGGDGTARVWDAITGEEINRLNTSINSDITVLALHPILPFVAVGTGKGELWVWELSGQENSKMELGQYTSISSVSYSSDGKLIATASYDKTARTWDANTGQEIARVTHPDSVLLAVLNLQGNLVASGSKDGTVKVWSPHTGQELFSIPKLQGVADLKFSADGRYLAIAEGLFSRDALFLFSGLEKSDSAMVSIWDVNAKKEVRHLQHPDWVNSIDFSPDGSLILTGGSDSQSRLWNISTGKVISSVPFSHRVNLVAYSSTGGLVAAAESCFLEMFGTNCRPILKVWNPSTGEVIWQREYSGIWVPGLTFSPDGKQLAIANTQAGSKGVVQVLDAHTGTLLNEKVYDNNFLLIALSYSHSGNLLAAGGGPVSDTGWVDIWDPVSGKALARIPYWQPWSVAFSPDDQQIAVGGAQDGIAYVKVVPVSQDDLIHNACARLTRNLTRQEWTEYMGNTEYQKTCDLNTTVNQPDENSDAPTISADGQTIAFVSMASNLTCNDTNQVDDVFLYDRQSRSIKHVSMASDGSQANHGSSHPVVSEHGEVVTFESTATNLIANDNNNFCGNTHRENCQDIFLYRAATNSIEVVSVNSEGMLGDNMSGAPSISSDGQYVVFASLATNLVQGDQNNLCDTNYDGKSEENCQDIFLYDTQNHVTSLVSVNSRGLQANGSSRHPVISPDGHFVIFYSDAKNLDPIHTDPGWYVRDLQTGITQSLPMNLGNWPAIGVSNEAKFIAGIEYMEGDGSLGEHELDEVVLYDTFSNSAKVVSAAPDLKPGNHDSDSPFLSPDGRYLVFSSEATNLVDHDTNLAYDIFLWDRTDNRLKRISLGFDNAQANGHSYAPAISSDGRFIVFLSTATNLVNNDDNIFTDVFIYDMQSGKTNRIEPIADCQ